MCVYSGDPKFCLCFSTISCPWTCVLHQKCPIITQTTGISWYQLWSPHFSATDKAENFFFLSFIIFINMSPQKTFKITGTIFYKVTILPLSTPLNTVLSETFFKSQYSCTLKLKLQYTDQKFKFLIKLFLFSLWYSYISI